MDSGGCPCADIPMPEVIGRRLQPCQEWVQPIPGGHSRGEAAASQARGSMEGRVRQQELAASGSWFICPLTIIITTTHRRLWETRRGSHRLPVELGFLENGTVMGYIYIKCGK